jgi:hypothetical protein
MRKGPTRLQWAPGVRGCRSYRGGAPRRTSPVLSTEIRNRTCSSQQDRAGDGTGYCRASRRPSSPSPDRRCREHVVGQVHAFDVDRADSGSSFMAAPLRGEVLEHLSGGVQKPAGLILYWGRVFGTEPWLGSKRAKSFDVARWGRIPAPSCWLASSEVDVPNTFGVTMTGSLRVLDEPHGGGIGVLVDGWNRDIPLPCSGSILVHAVWRGVVCLVAQTTLVCRWPWRTRKRRG